MGSVTSQRASNVERHSVLGEVVVGAGEGEGEGEEQMTVTRVIESEAEFHRWYRQVNKIDDSLSREVLLLPNRTVFESTGLCGSSGLVRLTYDHYPFVLQSEIDNRRRLARFFLEPELWYLLYTMVRAGSKFEKYRAKVGDVHPANILINNDGLLRLISTCSFPREPTNFDKLVDDPRAHVFLAPEELEQHSLERAEYPKNIDPAVAECYSIGLCALAAGTLEEVDSVYSVEGGERRVQRQKVNYFLKLFGEKYSSFLHSTVMGLLAESPFERKRCSEVYASLYEYEEQILNLESFLPGSSRLAPFPPAPRLAPNHYFHPNALLLSPIESKYVPVSPLHSQSVAFRQSFPNEEQRGFRPGPLSYHPR